jgi:glutamate-1-semialdehyde aminotransferase
VIPGSSQTFSKGFNQHVRGVAPVFLAKGKGCRVWDVDGNEYIDYIQGLLPNILGYATMKSMPRWRSNWRRATVFLCRTRWKWNWRSG